MMFTVPLHIHPEMNVITQTNKKEKKIKKKKYTTVLQWLGLLHQDSRITLEVPNLPTASPWE